MNRPNKEEYKVFDETQGCKRFTSFLYIEDLEKYCDEIENALDKACEILVERNACCEQTDEIIYECGVACIKHWKDRLLKDE